MAISFIPKAGMVLICDFRSNVPPEIMKVRPVVVISPMRIYRAGLCTVVPLSAKRPCPICHYHHLLPSNPIPGPPREIWAKCDLVTSVSLTRLDRVQIGRGKHVIGHVGETDLHAIRRKAALSFGIDQRFWGA
jgi:mRNA interferase MazF